MQIYFFEKIKLQSINPFVSDLLWKQLLTSVFARNVIGPKSIKNFSLVIFYWLLQTSSSIWVTGIEAL